MVSPSLYYPPGDIGIVRAQGLYMWDSAGKRYLDCTSGTFNLLLGHHHPEVVAAARCQLETLAYVSSSFRTDVLQSLAEALVSCTPPNLSLAHLRSSGGSTANEGAIRIAQYVTGKRDVITMLRGHLGQSMGTASLGGFAVRREPFPYAMPGAIHVPPPYCYRCFYGESEDTCALPCVSRIADFVKYASSGSVACLIIEPVFGVGGNFFPPDRYFVELKAFCEEKEIVLIFDEIQTGFGRTGHLFAADGIGVSPHIMTLAKGLSGCGLPLGAILTEERLAGLEKMQHGFTGGGSLPAAAAALKTLEIVSEPTFLAHVRRVGERLLKRLRCNTENTHCVGEVRGKGLMIGLEVVGNDGQQDSATAVQLRNVLQNHGVIVRVSEHGKGNVLEIRPPLNISPQQADEIADRIGEACCGMC